MKQNVRREALAGIHEYYTDTTAVHDAEREASEAFTRHYLEQLEDEAAADRRLMLRGIDPATGSRYTHTEFRELIQHMDLTYDEWSAVQFSITMRVDFEQDSIQFQEDDAWQIHNYGYEPFHDDYCPPTREQDIAWLQEIGDANIAAMIAADSRR